MYQQCYLVVQCLQQVGQFYGDVVIVDNGYVCWGIVQVEEIIGDQFKCCFWNIWVLWMCVGGDQDVFGIDVYVVVVFYGMCIDQMVVVWYVDYFVFVQVFEIIGMDVGDVCLVVYYQFFLVQCWMQWNIKVYCCSQVDVFGQIGCQLYGFFWYVVDVDVGVVEFIGFQYGYLVVVLCGVEGCCQVIGVVFQYDQVIVVVCCYWQYLNRWQVDGCLFLGRILSMLCLVVSYV